MLKLANEKDLESILRFCDGDLLGTRIGCYCLAYGFERDFLNIWIDGAGGKISTVIAKFYDSITLKTSDNAEEIIEFIYMIGFSSLNMNADTCRRLRRRIIYDIFSSLYYVLYKQRTCLSFESI